MHMMDTRRSDMLAAWRATGGAIEATGDAAERATGDDGIAASMGTGHFPMCADDGLAASMGTGHFPMCADDGLQASTGTFRPPMCIAD